MIHIGTVGSTGSGMGCTRLCKVNHIQNNFFCRQATGRFVCDRRRASLPPGHSLPPNRAQLRTEPSSVDELVEICNVTYGLKTDAYKSY